MPRHTRPHGEESGTARPPTGAIRASRRIHRRNPTKFLSMPTTCALGQTGSSAEIPDTPETLGLEVRCATVVKVTPQPELSGAREIAQRLESNWPTHFERALKGLAKARVIADSTLVPDDEEFRVRHLTKTTLVDTPRLRGTLKQGMPFDCRACIAICSGSLNTKVWTRVGLPVDVVDRSILHLRDLSVLRTMFSTVCEGVITHSVSALRDSASKREVEEIGALDIATISTNDEDLRELFLISAIDGKPSKKLLETELFRRVFEGKSPMKSRNSADIIWFFSTVNVHTRQGTIEPRPVLYCLSEGAKTIHVTGMAFDDSIQGELPHKASLDIATWVGGKL
jgi:hypothetical protein